MKEPYDAVGGRAAHLYPLPGACWRGKRFIVPDLQRDWETLRKEIQRELARSPADVIEYSRLLDRWEQAFLREQFYVRLAELAKMTGRA